MADGILLLNILIETIAQVLGSGLLSGWVHALDMGDSNPGNDMWKSLKLALAAPSQNWQ